MISIDNEAISFEKTIKFDCNEDLKGCKIEILIDADTYFTEFNSFVLNHNQMINPKDFKEGQLQRIVMKLMAYKEHPEVFSE